MVVAYAPKTARSVPCARSHCLPAGATIPAERFCRFLQARGRGDVIAAAAAIVLCTPTPCAVPRSTRRGTLRSACLSNRARRVIDRRPRRSYPGQPRELAPQAKLR